MERADVRRRMRAKEYRGRHERIRRSLIPHVLSGEAKCARCGESIEPGEDWHLGHSDRDRRFYSGPEHARCNRGAPMRNKTSRAW